MIEAPVTPGNKEHDIFEMLFDKDEITWQDIIYDLIKTEKMDPWDVDVSVLAEKFVSLLKEMKKMDFRLSGKIILAAAFFLKIKSDKLLKEDIVFLNNLITPQDDDVLDFLDDSSFDVVVQKEKPVLKYRTPQPRKRKVSVYDLVEALEKALEGDQKRHIRKLSNVAKKVKVPKKDKDMTVVINDLYKKIQKTLETVKHVQFSQLLKSEDKEEKIYTFIPLLYLDTQRRIDLEQEAHFEDITICLAKLKKGLVSAE
ncbi:segregation/condensation protein A [Candidatus Woesearchaeota archaeon]|nr:segregation/condensation protein A [Candidatus Woesearchaeota archaeon]